MPWYTTGTVAVTNGSGTVTGTGTAWVANVRKGDAFVGPGGITYEVTNVVSNTSMTIAPTYAGTTASGAAYRIMPTTSYDREIAASLAAVIADAGTNYKKANVLGTVSQSAGVPTGALLERGSNANGVYHKYADGLLICTVGTIASSAAGTIDWVFPHPFAYPGNPERAVVSGSAGTTGANAWRLIIGGLAAGDRIQFGAVDKTGAFVVANCSMSAIGRWY